MNWIAFHALGEVSMRRHCIVFSSAAICFFLGSLPSSALDTKSASAQSDPWYNPKKYDPRKLFKRDPKSANDKLASNSDLETKLTHQLRMQGILPRAVELQDACSTFKELADCVASLRVSHALQIDFSCLKWDVTGVKPRPVADSCAGPAGGKAMGLYRATDLLKPDADAKGEAKNALRRAREDIKDASE